MTWFLNGVVVSNDFRHKILVNEQGNHSLMFTEALVQDCGVLSCIAKNKSGEATAEVRVEWIVAAGARSGFRVLASLMKWSGILTPLERRGRMSVGWSSSPSFRGEQRRMEL